MVIKQIVWKGIDGINIGENRMLKLGERLSALKAVTVPWNCN